MCLISLKKKRKLNNQYHEDCLLAESDCETLYGVSARNKLGSGRAYYFFKGFYRHQMSGTMLIHILSSEVQLNKNLQERFRKN